MTSGIKITNAARTISADLTNLNPKWQRTISNPVIVVTVPATDGKVGTKTANLKMMSDQISIRFTVVESFATNFLLPTSSESTVIGKLTYLTKYISAPKLS